MTRQRLLELDSIRGIAAISVVFYHYFYRYNDIYGHTNIPFNWISKGNYGVELFFMVSGFVIFWTLNKVERPLDFIVSRLSRLYPTYWAALFLTFLAILTFGLPGRELTFSTAISNMLMFHEYLNIQHIDGVYWTLTIELTFYFWMFTVYVAGGLKKIEYILIVITTTSIFHSLGVIQVNPTIYRILIMEHIPLFMAGICFYKAISSNTTKLTFITLSVSLSSIAFTRSPYDFIIFTVIYTLFYLAITERLPVLKSRILTFLGSISYALYLTHQNIGYIIINKFYSLQWNPLAGILTATILSVAIALSLTKFIEKPSLNYIRKIYSTSKTLQVFAEKFTIYRKKPQ